MRFEYLPIEKENIPYRFDIALPVEIYTFEIRYNATHDFFTVDLFKEDEALVLGEKVIYGVPLFQDVYDRRFPAPTIVPLDESGNEQRITFENLGVTVFLVVMNQ